MMNAPSRYPHAASAPPQLPSVPPGPLAEPQKSPPPPRPDRSQRSSPWSPLDYTPPSATRRVLGGAGVSPSEATQQMPLQRQSTARTHRQLDWSLDETGQTPPQQTSKSASLLPEASNTTDGKSSSGIRVLSTSFDVLAENGSISSPAHALRVNGIRGPLSGPPPPPPQPTMTERAGDVPVAVADALGDKLVALAATHAARIAWTVPDQQGSRTITAGDSECRVACQRVVADQLPPSLRTGESVLLVQGTMRLPCTFPVARQVLSQPNAQTHWDRRLVSSTVQRCLDRRRRAAVVRDTHRDPQGLTESLKLCVTREDFWTSAEHTTPTQMLSQEQQRQRRALESLTAAVARAAHDETLTLRRTCVWASTTLTSTPIQAKAPTIAETRVDSPNLTGILLLDLSSCSTAATDTASARQTWLVFLRSSSDPRLLNASKLQEQCLQLSALCALEQDAVEASSMEIELSPVRFPRPTTSGIGRSEDSALTEGDLTSLDVHLRRCLDLATDITTASAAGLRAPRTLDRFARQAAVPRATSPTPPAPTQSVALGRSPEPRTPPVKASATLMSSSSSSSSFVSARSTPLPSCDSSSFSSSSAPHDAAITPHAAADRRAEVHHREPVLLAIPSPALSHNMDGLSSIQAPIGTDQSFHGLSYPITPTATGTECHPSPRVAPLTSMALYAQNRAYRRETTKAPGSPTDPHDRPADAAAAQKNALAHSPFRQQPIAKRKNRSAVTTPSSLLRVTLLYCTGLPRFAADTGRGDDGGAGYCLGVVLRLASGGSVQSEWYPYHRDVNFSVSDDADGERSNVLDCPFRPTRRSSSNSRDDDGNTADALANESLTVTVVVQTPQKKIRLGIATVHAGNLRAQKPTIVACHIVGKAGTADAHERCLLHLSLVPVRAGLPSARCVTLVEEARRRLLIWRTLQSSAPRHLHRLEWFVGLCRPLTARNTDMQDMLHRLIAGGGDEGKEHAAATTTVDRGRTSTTAQQQQQHQQRTVRHTEPTTTTTATRRRTVSARAFKPRRATTTTTRTIREVPMMDQRAADAPVRASVPSSVHATSEPDQHSLRRSLSMPLLRPNARPTVDRVAARDTTASQQLYTVELRVAQIDQLCDGHGELLTACASTFAVVTLHQRPGLRDGRPRSPSSRVAPGDAAPQTWMTSSTAYAHHRAVFTQSTALVLDVPDLYDTVARVTVMAGNAACHSVVGYCDVSLRYVLASDETAPLLAGDVAGDGRGRRFRLFRARTQAATSPADATDPNNAARAFVAVGNVYLDVRCRQETMRRYLSRTTVHDALTAKCDSATVVLALLARYRPSLLPSLDVQLDQVAPRGLRAFVKRKSQLWECPCSLDGMATLRVRVLSWSLYATPAVSPLVSDPQRFTAVADPRAIALHARRLGKVFGKAKNKADSEALPCVYVVAHCGGAVFAMTADVQSFSDGFNVTTHLGSRLSSQVVSNPDTDVLSLRVLQRVADGGADYEIGRVDLPLSVFYDAPTPTSRAALPPRRPPQRLSLPLTSNAGTRVAYTCGSLSVEIEVEPLSRNGHSSDAANMRTAVANTSSWRGFDEGWAGRTRLEHLLYLRAPWQLHRLLVLLKPAYTDAEAEAVWQSHVKDLGQPREQDTVKLQLIALRSLDPDVKTCYVKVYHGDAAVLRTGTIHVTTSGSSSNNSNNVPNPSASSSALGEALLAQGDTSTATVHVTDAAHDVLFIKIGREKRLGRNAVIARTQVSLAGIEAVSPQGAPEVWLPLFDTTETSSRHVGDVCVKLFRSEGIGGVISDALVATPAVSRSGVHLEQQKRDVVSLLQAYAPVELPRVHSLLAATAPVPVSTPSESTFSPAATAATASSVVARSAHVPLRSMLAPLSVAATVHITVEGVELAHDNLLPLDVLNADCLQLAMSTLGAPVATCACPLISSAVASRQRASAQSKPVVSTTVVRLDVPAALPLDGESAAEQTALDIVLEHTSPVPSEGVTGLLLRGRFASTPGSRSASGHSRRTSVVSRTGSSAAASRGSSLGRESSGGRASTTPATTEDTTGAAPLVLAAVPVGQCRVSLRALLTPELYVTGEVLSVPLICSARTLSFRLTAPQRQQFEQSLSTVGLRASDDWFMLGRLRFAVQLAGGDRAPSWLRLPIPRGVREEEVRTRRRRALKLEKSLETSHDIKAIARVHFTAFETDANVDTPFARRRPRSAEHQSSATLAQQLSVVEQQSRSQRPQPRSRSALDAQHQPRSRIAKESNNNMNGSPAPRRPTKSTRTIANGAITPPRHHITRTAVSDDQTSLGDNVTQISTPSWTVCSVPSQRPRVAPPAWSKQPVLPRDVERVSLPTDGHGRTFLVSPSTLDGSQNAP